MTLQSRYHDWLWRPGGRRARKWEAARQWAERISAEIDKLPPEQQASLDAIIARKVAT